MSAGSFTPVGGGDRTGAHAMYARESGFQMQQMQQMQQSQPSMFTSVGSGHSSHREGPFAAYLQHVPQDTSAPYRSAADHYHQQMHVRRFPSPPPYDRGGGGGSHKPPSSVMAPHNQRVHRHPGAGCNALAQLICGLAACQLLSGHCGLGRALLSITAISIAASAFSTYNMPLFTVAMIAFFCIASPRNF